MIDVNRNNEKNYKGIMLVMRILIKEFRWREYSQGCTLGNDTLVNHSV